MSINTAHGGSNPVLAIRDLSVKFRTDDGIVDAVNGIDLVIHPGEIHALVGESGSGKSVTSMAIMGLLPGTAIVTGSMQLLGEALDSASESRMDEIRGAKISMIFQEPMTALNPTMTIGSQVAEVLLNHSDMSKADALEEATALLARVGIPEPERRAKGFPHEMSGGQRQRVVIAIALACKPMLIIADEPTTALDVTVQAEILDLIRDLAADSDTAFLLITHNMGVVADVASRVSVMYRGDIVESGDVNQVLLAPEADYSRRLLDAVPKLPNAEWDTIESEPARATDPAVSGTKVEEPVLSFESVCVDFRRGATSFRAVDNVSLTIGKAEIVGLVGESGSGKSTLGRAALGLAPVSEGKVTLFGEPIAERAFISKRERAVRRQLGVVFQDPGSSLDPRMTIAECVAEPLAIHGWHGRRATRAVRDARVKELLDAVELPSGYERRYPHELSGGQRQRVGLARAIALDPSLLIADEPTSALDVSVQANVLAVLRELQERFQFACLFISHDLAVVHSMSHRVAVMLAGEIVEVGDASEVLIRPRNPYSRRLLAAAPTPNPHEQARRRQARARLAALPDLPTSDSDRMPGASA